MDKPPEDTDRIDDAILALLFYGGWREKYAPDNILRAWKSFDWDAMDRLFQKGLIDNPKNKNKSVYLTEEGVKRGEALFDAMFRKQAESAAD